MILDYGAPAARTAEALPPEYFAEGDSGLVILCDVSSNTVDTVCAPPSQSTCVSVDATFAYASSHYDDLLRRLAD